MREGKGGEGERRQEDLRHEKGGDKGGDKVREGRRRREKLLAHLPLGLGDLFAAVARAAGEL